MVLLLYPTSRRGIDFRVPRAGRACTYVYARTTLLQNVASGQVRTAFPLRAPCGNDEGRHSPRLWWSVREWTLTAVHMDTRARVCADATAAIYAAGFANDQTHSGIKFRWRARVVCAATRRGTAPQLHPDRRGEVAFLCEPWRPFMLPIIIENDVTVCAREIGLLDSIYIAHSARKALSGG